MPALPLAADGLLLGLWFALALLLVAALLGVAGQAFSLIVWDRAVAPGLQEDDPRSGDPMQRDYFTVAWGLALADVVMQSAAFLMALYGLLARRWLGVLGGTILFTLAAHYAIASYARRDAIRRWRRSDDARWRGSHSSSSSSPSRSG